MSGTRTAERPTIDQFGARFGDDLPAAEQLPAVMPMTPGSRADQAMAGIITAQRVAVKRNLPQILKDIDELALVGADKFYYEWATKNKDGTTGSVVGPSIKCAMALVNAWGNCAVECFPAQETATHWTFLARFVDYEKGVTVSRSYQQRKSQRAGGRMDGDRATDMAFAIGQSKGIRNVVVAALSMYVDRAVDTARGSAFAWIEKNPAKARQILEDQAAKLRVPIERMETLIQRKAEKWVARDMLALRAKLQSIEDGFDDIDTAFPLPGDDDEIEAEQRPPVTAKTTPPVTDAGQQTDTKPRRQAARPTTAEKPADKSAQRPADTDGEQPRTEPPASTAPAEPRDDGDMVQGGEPQIDRQDDPGPDSSAADDDGELNFG